MKKSLLLFLFVRCSSLLWAQLSFEFSTHDFGEVDRETLRWIDLEVTNKEKKTAQILRLEAPRSITYRISKKELAPDSTMFIRLFIDPFEKGSFKEKVLVWTSSSNKPKTIVLKANVLETATMALQSCPDFGDVNPYKIGFDLAVEVVMENGKPIENVTILIGRSSQETFTGKTNQNGLVGLKAAAIGLYRIQAKQENIVVADEMVYFNRRNSKHTIRIKGKPEFLTTLPTLSKQKSTKKPSPEINKVGKTNEKEQVVAQTVGKLNTSRMPKTIVKEENIDVTRVEQDVPSNSTSMVDAAIEAELAKMDTLSVSSNVIDDAIERELANRLYLATEQEKLDSIATIVALETQQQAALDPKDFSRVDYVPNNIVFLLDVSTSMRYLERIDLLKISLIELTSKLRDIDYMSIVTYASHARTILIPTQGNQKLLIDSLIWSLDAKGTTASDKGLDQAYGVSEDAFIEGGNNQIILVTDGAFEAKGFYRLIRKKAKEQIKLSVVGIKTEKNIALELAEMAKQGQGSFVNIKDLTAAKTVLVSEIKNNSKKR
jgi:Mg-chelatase subunit ChlD